MKRASKAHALGALLSVLGAVAMAEDAEINNGTDPTKLSTTAQLRFESLDLGDGFTNNTLYLRFTQPLGAAQRSSVELKLPIVSSNILDGSDYGMGDFSLKFTRLASLTPQYGILLTLEAIFDTADAADQGTGSNVLKPGITYARFLPNGAIFAPTLQHGFTVGSADSGRPDVNQTVIDFYYVPKLNDPLNYMTIDPALTYDWESEKLSPTLAVTLGRVIPMGLPGSSSLFVKPSIGFGGDRAYDWGIEVGFKVVGF
jgi:hypothetical protein